jgi:small subunit ribosomal protein S17
MAKVLVGKVISVKMQDTAVVEVTRRVPHKLYKKLLKRSEHFKVDTKGQEVSLGKTVRFQETRPISKDKHFKVIEVLADRHAKTEEKKA